MDFYKKKMPFSPHLNPNSFLNCTKLKLNNYSNSHASYAMRKTYVCSIYKH